MDKHTYTRQPDGTMTHHINDELRATVAAGDEQQYLDEIYHNEDDLVETIGLDQDPDQPKKPAAAAPVKRTLSPEMKAKMAAGRAAAKAKKAALH